jgi:hypothetical protein
LKGDKLTELEKAELLKEVEVLDLKFQDINRQRMDSQHEYWADMVNIRNRQAVILAKIKEG